MLVSKSYVIKVSPKSDMAIVQIDIWNVQSGSNTKMLINKCFNVSNYIATIWEANMNSEVSQCKNCWRWVHSMFCTKFKGPSAYNAIGLTKQNTTANLYDAVKQTKK